MHHLSRYAQHPKLDGYQKAAGEVRDMVVMARQGKYKEGYLSLLCEALAMLKRHASEIPGMQKDVPMIETLYHEFQEQLNGPIESPLAGLFEEHNPKD